MWFVCDVCVCVCVCVRVCVIYIWVRARTSDDCFSQAHHINRLRPAFVIVCGDLTNEFPVVGESAGNNKRFLLLEHPLVETFLFTLDTNLETMFSVSFFPPFSQRKSLQLGTLCLFVLSLDKPQSGASPYVSQYQ